MKLFTSRLLKHANHFSLINALECIIAGEKEITSKLIEIRPTKNIFRFAFLRKTTPLSSKACAHEKSKSQKASPAQSSAGV